MVNLVLIENEIEIGDHDIDRLMEDYMNTWISENLTDLQCLSICIGDEHDFPHPRHLCFKYPFRNSSFEKHCKKCYCYVCEEVAPCKKWNKSTKKHCNANEDGVWKSEKKARKKVSSFNTTMARHTLSISFMHHPPEQTVLISGFGGGLITDIKGKWVTG